jgi:hypothetical protein
VGGGSDNSTFQDFDNRNTGKRPWAALASPQKDHRTAERHSIPRPADFCHAALGRRCWPATTGTSRAIATQRVGRRSRQSEVERASQDRLALAATRIVVA